ncbi:MAG: retropepsin-like aspartic protease [Cyanobacteria bacterium]|nr:retropepsin-like aspartic protease [Cyanobacteriota bacterium]
MLPPLLLALVAALIQLRGQPLAGGILSGSASFRLERASGGDTPVLTLNSPGGVVRLLLDSGASSTMVTPALAHRLGLSSQVLSNQELELAAGGSGCAALRPRRTRLPPLELASLEQVGQLRLSGIEALLLPVAALPPGIDGVLGIPSLRQLPFWIDPQRHRLALGAAALQAARDHDSWARGPRGPLSQVPVSHNSDSQNPLSRGAFGNGSITTGPIGTDPITAGPHGAGLLSAGSVRIASEQAQVIPLRWRRGVPLLDLNSPGGTVAALADTGAEGLFISPALAARLQPQSPGQSLRLTGFCGEQDVELRRYAGLAMPGNGRPPNQPAVLEAIRIENPIFAQLGVEAIVGQELLRSRPQLWRLESKPPRLELR